MRTHGIIALAALSLLGHPAKSQPSCAEAICTPAIAITRHEVTADDYPAESIRAQEQGAVAIRYVIDERGEVAECTIAESSGYARLDEAACAMIRNRWKYKAATANGEPVSQNTTANIVFS